MVFRSRLIDRQGQRRCIGDVRGIICAGHGESVRSLRGLCDRGRTTAAAATGHGEYTSGHKRQDQQRSMPAALPESAQGGERKK